MAESSEPESESDDAGNEENDNMENIDFELPESVPYRRMPCMAHTIQLLIKPVCQDTKTTAYFGKVVAKARKIVSSIKKSSVMTQELMTKTKKTVVSDVCTRWNSTYFMAKRLVELKTAVNDLLICHGIDTLLVSEWQKLEEMIRLLEPFAIHTDVLQSDSRSMSYIIPALIDLKIHLQLLATSGLQCAQDLLDDFMKRFDAILNPACSGFNPLPCVACLLDPSVASKYLIILLQQLN